MSILFDCPFCTYSKKLPDSYLHKKIKCPRCLATLTLGLPQPTALTALPLPDDDESPLEQTAIEVDQRDGMQECPFCFEVISISAKECPSCCCLLDQDSITARVESYRQQSMQIFRMGMAALIFGIGILIGPWILWKGSALIRQVRHIKELDWVYGGMIMATMGILNSIVFLIGLCLFL